MLDLTLLANTVRGTSVQVMIGLLVATVSGGTPVATVQGWTVASAGWSVFPSSLAEKPHTESAAQFARDFPVVSPFVPE